MFAAVFSSPPIRFAANTIHPRFRFTAVYSSPPVLVRRRFQLAVKMIRRRLQSAVVRSLPPFHDKSSNRILKKFLKIFPDLQTESLYQMALTLTFAIVLS